MKRISYCAIFTPDDETQGAINIEFPDLPGCISCAYSYSEAKKYAKEALTLYLDGKNISDIPNPSIISEKTIFGKNVVKKITIIMNEKHGKLVGFKISHYK